MNHFAPLTVYQGHKAFLCPPGWHWYSPVNRWTGLHLWLVVQGRGHMQTPDGLHPACAGDCFLLRMNEVNIGCQDDRYPLVVHAVNFELMDAAGNRVTVGAEDLPHYRRVEDAPFISRLIDMSLDALVKGERQDAEHWLRSALLRVQHADQYPITIPAANARLIDDLCRRIQADPGARYAVADLAGKIGWSPDHLIRVFRQSTRMTPGEFVIAARIDEAKKLLRFSDYPIAEIAAMLGYNTPFFFSRQFHARVGLSPTAYRNGR